MNIFTLKINQCEKIWQKKNTSPLSKIWNLALRNVKCEIKISQIHEIYDALFTYFIKQKGVGDSEFLNLIKEKLKGWCPKCKTIVPGNIMSMVAMQQDGTFSGALMGSSGGTTSLINGRCPNARCSSDIIGIYWGYRKK